MSHSMIDADRGTHCKIVAVALAGAICLVMVAIAARPPASEAPVARAQGDGTGLEAGKPTIAREVGQPATATRSMGATFAGPKTS